MSTASLNTISQFILLICILIFLIFAFSTPSQARRGASKINMRGTSELEARFFNELKEGSLRSWSLADAFFIASGIRDEKNLESARSWYESLVKEAQKELSAYRSVSDRGDHLLRWLHKRVFQSYQAQATDAFDVIKTGRFNCLSSCLVYGMIGERLGLHIRGIAVDQHAFCRVYPKPISKHSRSIRSRSGGWDVETTTALGFNPGRSVQLDRAVVSVPRSRYRNRRELSLLEMIGLIYTNHVGMTRAYPSHEDRLLAYQKAALFFPRDATIQHNILAAHTQVIQDYASRRRWQGAQAFLTQLVEFDEKDQFATALWLQVAELHLDDVSRQGLEATLKTLSEYTTQAPQVPKAAWIYLESHLYSRAATHLNARRKSEEGDEYFIKACTNAHKAKSRSGLPQKTRKVLQRLQHNHLVMIKNYLIDLINQRQSQRAKRLLNIAIKTHPQDRDLQRMKQNIR